MARADFEKPRTSGPALPIAAMLHRVFKPAMANYFSMNPKSGRRHLKAHNYRRWKAQALRLPDRGEQ